MNDVATSNGKSGVSFFDQGLQRDTFKGPVQRFSKQFKMNKCFLLNPEKNLAKIRALVYEKNVKTA